MSVNERNNSLGIVNKTQKTEHMSERSRAKQKAREEANQKHISQPTTFNVEWNPSESRMKQLMKDDTFKKLYYAIDALIVRGGPAAELLFGEGNEGGVWDWNVLNVRNGIYNYNIPVPVSLLGRKNKTDITCERRRESGVKPPV